MKKFLICFFAITILFAFVGCSSANDDSEIIGGADEKTAIIVTDSNDNMQTTEQVTEVTTAPVVNVSEKLAKSISSEKLEEEYSVDRAKAIGLGCDYTDFEFDRIEFIYYGEGGYYDTFDAVKEKGHSYYCVTYENTTQLCDVAYFLVDAVDGEILLSGYMGD